MQHLFYVYSLSENYVNVKCDILSRSLYKTSDEFVKGVYEKHILLCYSSAFNTE